MSASRRASVEFANTPGDERFGKLPETGRAWPRWVATNGNDAYFVFPFPFFSFFLFGWGRAEFANVNGALHLYGFGWLRVCWWGKCGANRFGFAVAFLTRLAGKILRYVDICKRRVGRGSEICGIPLKGRVKFDEMKRVDILFF